VSRILLDTHALLWFVANDVALPGSARALIESADEAMVSIASVWEIAIKGASLDVPLGR
jgi:PIN domain nuclease of toxin-antitoxin system